MCCGSLRCDCSCKFAFDHWRDGRQVVANHQVVPNHQGVIRMQSCRGSLKWRMCCGSPGCCHKSPRRCDSHTKLLWAIKLTDVLRITKVLRITMNHWSVMDYADVLLITEVLWITKVLWFSRKFSPWVTKVLRTTRMCCESLRCCDSHAKLLWVTDVLLTTRDVLRITKVWFPRKVTVDHWCVVNCTKVLRLTKVLRILRKVPVDHWSVMDCTAVLRVIKRVADHLRACCGSLRCCDSHAKLLWVTDVLWATQNVLVDRKSCGSLKCCDSNA